MALTAVKKRCRFCRKVMRNDGTAEQPKWVCNNPKCFLYVPPKEAPSESEEKPSEGNNTDTTEKPSTGESAQSDGESTTDTNDGGNTETEPTP